MDEIQLKVKQIEAYANRIVSMKKIVDAKAMYEPSDETRFHPAKASG